jgi:hypothetical protein
MCGFQYRVLNTVIAGLAGSKRIRVLRRIVLLREVFMGKQSKPDNDVGEEGETLWFRLTVY